ncbi:hypothetical protein HK104_008651 [Borealophlyctis nickersoniae]|nr:hypothetical protein HK104_008651 [Borealophlyctis nickersoniae]
MSAGEDERATEFADAAVVGAAEYGGYVWFWSGDVAADWFGERAVVTKRWGANLPTLILLGLGTYELFGTFGTQPCVFCYDPEFQMLHIDPLVIGRINAQKQGDHIKRKNGFIVNSGGKLSREEKLKRIKENKEKYELPEEVWSAIELPRRDDPAQLLEQKRQTLAKLKEELEVIRVLIVAKRAEMEENEFNGGEVDGEEDREDDDWEDHSRKGKRVKIH